MKYISAGAISMRGTHHFVIKGVNYMNLHNFAVYITREEKLKKQVNIAQVKEILKITLRMLKDMSLAEITNLLKKQK